MVVMTGVIMKTPERMEEYQRFQCQTCGSSSLISCRYSVRLYANSCTSQADLRSSSHSAFIHSQPIQSSAHTEDDHSNDTTMTPSKLRKDKRRRVEESLALVDDPASRKGSPLDDLLHPSSDRLVSIQWSQIAYITVRDQVSVLLKLIVLRCTRPRA